MFKIKIIIFLVAFLSIVFYFYGNSILEFAMRPAQSKKIKYTIDLSRIQKLKKGSITKEVIEEIINNKNSKVGEVYYYKEDFRQGTINYDIYIKKVSIHIYDCLSEIDALAFYKSSVAPTENRLYDYKGTNLQYYATYMFQHRSSLWGLYRLLDEYNTIFKIQNDNVAIMMYDSDKSKDKKELQEVIDLIADTVEKHSNRE